MRPRRYHSGGEVLCTHFGSYFLAAPQVDIRQPFSSAGPFLRHDVGKPKAIIHPAGGMLLARKVIAQYHINLDYRDVCCMFSHYRNRIFSLVLRSVYDYGLGNVCIVLISGSLLTPLHRYNISLCFLANGCTLITYDGSPLRPIGVMWDILQTHK